MYEFTKLCPSFYRFPSIASFIDDELQFQDTCREIVCYRLFRRYDSTINVDNKELSLLFLKSEISYNVDLSEWVNYSTKFIRKFEEIAGWDRSTIKLIEGHNVSSSYIICWKDLGKWKESPLQLSFGMLLIRYACVLCRSNFILSDNILKDLVDYESSEKFHGGSMYFHSLIDEYVFFFEIYTKLTESFTKEDLWLRTSALTTEEYLNEIVEFLEDIEERTLNVKNPITENYEDFLEIIEDIIDIERFGITSFLNGTSHFKVLEERYNNIINSECSHSE